MKKTCLAAALLLLLCGCGSPAPQPSPTQSAATAPESIPIESTPTPETQIQEEPPMETQAYILHDPKDTDIVRVRDYIPDVVEDLKYATPNNFTGSVIYPFQDVYLRYGTVKKLAAVQEELRSMGLGIKIWDGFRPVSAQFQLWEICPDDTYVANPNVGYSNHSRGFAVDLTLVDATGQELEMPTGFDDFSGKADRDYTDVSPTAKANSLLLEGIMEKHGFKGYWGEWWHYNDATRYEVEHVFDPGLISSWRVAPEESVTLLSKPQADADPISAIPAGDPVTVMGYDGDYALVTWNGVRGYLPCISLILAEH